MLLYSTSSIENIPRVTCLYRMRSILGCELRVAVVVQTGFKLFGLELRVATRLVWKQLHGDTLTRRERKQLTQTTADLFRMVPFTFFIIVPFAELLLPVALRLFPNMLPSTFQTQLKKVLPSPVHL
jgi:cytochrome b561